MNEEVNTESIVENNTNITPEAEKKKGTSKIVIIFFVIMILGLCFVFFKDDIFKKKNPIIGPQAHVDSDFKVTYSIVTNYYEKVFAKDDFAVYLNTDYDLFKENEVTGEYARLWTKYYVVNKQTQTIYSSYLITKADEKKTEGDNYYFIVYEDDNIDEAPFVRGIFNVKNQKMLMGYSDYSCQFHSDDSINSCENVYATMVTSNAGDTANRGIISLEDYSTIIKPEYFSIVEINDNFLVSTKNNKSGLFNNKGKKLLDVNYDYIGYNDYIGYIAIKGNDIELYNTKFEKQEVGNTTLKDLFTEAYAKYESEHKNDDDFKNYLFFEIADSYFWSIGSAMQIHNLNEPFDRNEDQTEYRYRYIGKKYKGEQLVINSLCTEKYIYVIQGTKAYKITRDEIFSKQSDDNSYCF